MKKLTNTIAGCFCLMMLFLPLGLSLTPFNQEEYFVREIEKRKMEEWPRIGSWRDCMNISICRQISLFVRDRLPGRGRVILMKNGLAYQAGEWRFNEVDRGKEGWLFIRGGYYRPWETQADVRKTLRRLEYLLRFREAGEPTWTFYVGPDKDEVYPEKLSPLLGRLEAWAGRRREMIANFCADFNGPEIDGMWETFLATKRSSPEPVYFKLDTHHTNLGMLVLTRAIVERFQPGIWNPAEVVAGEKTTKVSDLALLAGLGGWREPEQKYGIRREGVELVKEETAPGGDWKKPAHYISRSATRPMITGRTLLLHDSLLAEARPLLRQFFENLTCMHYDDFILENVLDDGRRRHYDRIIMEVAARQATFVWERLLRLLNAKPLQKIALDTLAAFDEKNSVQTSLAAEGLHFSTRGKDAKIYLPPLRLPAGRDYLLRVEMDADRRGLCELFYRETYLEAYSEAKRLQEEIRPGRNWFCFPVSAANLAAGLRFDPSTDTATLLIRSLQVCRIEPAWPEGLMQGMGDQETLSPINLWIEPARASRTDSDAQRSLPVIGNEQIRMRQTCRGLEVWAEGEDPMLFLPGWDCGETGEVVLSLEMEASQDTLCQLFFKRSPVEEHSERRSQIRQLHAGMNRFNFAVPAAALKCGLRLDPACKIGSYLIRRLTVRKKSKWDWGMPKASGVDLIYPYDPLVNWSEEKLVNVQAGRGTKSRLTQRGLELQSETDHPTVFLPGVATEGEGPVVVNLLLEATRRTTCRLFYREAHSVPVELNAGLNQMLFVLPAEAVRRGLRFDPASHAGTYQLRAVEFGRWGGARSLRSWYENLAASRMRELFTFNSSRTLMAWQPGELAIRRQGGSAGIAIPGPPAPWDGGFILHARIKSAGEAKAAFSYSAAGQKAYNESPNQTRMLLPGWNDLYFYLEGGGLGKDMRLDISPAGAFDSLERMEMRKLYGSEP